MEGKVLTIEEMKTLKRTLGYTNEYVAKASGVPLGTVQKIFGSTTSSPRRKTIEALSLFFEGEMKDTRDNVPRGNCGLVNESVAAYEGVFPEKKQGEYVLDDYLALPEERRVEMIDGVFYDMSSPASVHQLIAGLIYARLAAFIRDRKGKCLPFIAPMDVQLDCDDKTIVQPDVMVVCDRKKVTWPRIVGAPDFVVEVLSRSTRRKDMLLKSYKYERAGVREYWLVDPDEKNVIVWLFGEEIRHFLYSFSDQIPVGISGGECVIDFAEIYDSVSFVYQQERE